MGKSSLINTLLGRTRRKEARVSAQPGKTRELNFFAVNEEFFLVDLPGYGYAAVPDEIRAGWARLTTWYLSESGGAIGVVQLIDSRHDPTRNDLDRLALLAEIGVPTLVVLTKVDKLRARPRRTLLSRACTQLDLDPDQIVCSSAKSGEGREELLQALEELQSV